MLNHTVLTIMRRCENHFQILLLLIRKCYSTFHGAWTLSDGPIEKRTMIFWGLIIGQVATSTRITLLPHLCKRTRSMQPANLQRATFTRQPFLDRPSEKSMSWLWQTWMNWATAQLLHSSQFPAAEDDLATFPDIDVEQQQRIDTKHVKFSSSQIVIHVPV